MSICGPNNYITSQEYYKYMSIIKKENEDEDEKDNHGMVVDEEKEEVCHNQLSTEQLNIIQSR